MLTVHTLKNYSRVHLLVLSVIGLTGVGLILACTQKFGAGVSPDSANYIAAARSLLAGKGFLRFNNVICDSWPPLYSTLLATLKLAGIDYFISGRYISAVSLGLIVFMSGLWLLKNSGFFSIAVLGSICILFAKPLFNISCMIWSEPLFVVLVMAFFFILPFALEKPTIKWGLLLALVTAATALTRYVGVVLIPIGAFLLVVNRKQLFWKRATFVTFWTIGSALPLTLWLLRNWLITGNLAGKRLPSDTGFFENVSFAGEVVASWFLPSQLANSIPGWIFFCLFCAFITVMLISAISKSAKHNQYWLDSPSIPLVLFLIVYTVTILSAATRTRIDVLNDRLLAPLYVPAALLFLASIANAYSLDLKLSQNKKEIYHRLIRTGLLAGISIGIWLGTSSNYVLALGQYRFRYGAGGIRHLRWQKSETIAWLQKHRLQGHIFTSNPAALYILAGYTAENTPALPVCYGNSPAGLRESQRQISDFKSVVESENNAYIVWFSPGRENLYDPNKLRDFCRMKTVKRLKDGVVIALYPK